MGAGQGARDELPPNSALHIAAFVNRPKDVQDSSTVPEEFSFTAFLALFLFLPFPLCVCFADGLHSAVGVLTLLDSIVADEASWSARPGEAAKVRSPEGAMGPTSAAFRTTVACPAGPPKALDGAASSEVAEAGRLGGWGPHVFVFLRSFLADGLRRPLPDVFVWLGTRAHTEGLSPPRTIAAVSSAEPPGPSVCTEAADVLRTGPVSLSQSRISFCSAHHMYCGAPEV